MKTANPAKILISGASFAGLSTAFWMNKFGYQVTIVEIAPELKKVVRRLTYWAVQLIL